MNKSVLLLICDFLMLSILTMGRFEDSTERSEKAAVVSLSLNGAAARQFTPDQQRAQANLQSADPEILALLKQSLEEERTLRAQLNEELTKAQSRLGQTDQQLTQVQQNLRTREDLLAERDRRLRQSEEKLQRKEQEARQLETSRTALEQQLAAKATNLISLQEQYQLTRSNLAALEKQQAATRDNLAAVQQKYAAARTNVTQLQEQLAATSSEAKVSQQVLAALQDDLRKHVNMSGQLQQQLQEMEKSRQLTEAEKQQLSTKLQVAETEKRLKTEQVESLRGEVQVVRAEKTQLQQQTAKLAENTTKLTENVSALAVSSEKLTDEIRQSRPLSANSIFAEFNSNRVETTFQGTRSGIFGQTVHKDLSAKTILVSRAGQIFALYHIEDTPFSLEPFPLEWESLTGTIGHGTTIYSITQLSFLDRDPRIVIIPIGKPQAEKLGCKIYPIAADPFKFQDAILIGATEGYYGESKFQVDATTPHYVRMQRERFSRLSGKFLPSRGDLVFSNTGELLGIMANKEYCLVLDNCVASRTLPAGSSLVQTAAPLISRMYREVTGLPPRLQ